MPNAYHTLNKCYLLYPLFLIFSSKINCAALFLQQSLEICGWVFNKYLLTTHYVLHIVLGRDDWIPIKCVYYRNPNAPRKLLLFKRSMCLSTYLGWMWTSQWKWFGVGVSFCPEGNPHIKPYPPSPPIVLLPQTIGVSLLCYRRTRGTPTSHQPQPQHGREKENFCDQKSPQCVH